MAKAIASPSEIVVHHNSGSFLIPKNVLVAHELTIEQIADKITNDWRNLRKKGHASAITITTYYWTAGDAWVISWRPKNQGRLV